MKVTVELTTINCGCCGGTYAINERYRRKKEETAGSWKCPYCSVNWGYATTALDKERDKRISAENQLRRSYERQDELYKDAERTARRLRAQKAATTRLRNKITGNA